MPERERETRKTLDNLTPSLRFLAQLWQSLRSMVGSLRKCFCFVSKNGSNKGFIRAIYSSVALTGVQTAFRVQYSWKVMIIIYSEVILLTEETVNIFFEVTQILLCIYAG